jgi:hypothetical protein
MSNLDIFNLDAEAFVTKAKKETPKELIFTSPIRKTEKTACINHLSDFYPTT